MENKNLLNIQEASRLLGVKPITLRKWDREGKLKAIRIGTRRDRRYRKKALDTFLKNQTPKLVWQEYIRSGCTYHLISQMTDSSRPS